MRYVLRLAPWFAMVNDGAALERSILSASQCDAGICRVRRELFLRECSPPPLARKWQRPGVTRAIRTEPSSRDAAGEAFISPPSPLLLSICGARAHHLRRGPEPRARGTRTRCGARISRTSSRSRRR